MTRNAAGLLTLTLFAAILITLTTIASIPSWPAPPRVVADSGVVEGRVIYKADSKRPWRYARYYIKNQSRGELAEAVVALAGQGLRGRSATDPALARMDQKDFRFVPETIAIQVGDSVQFTNSDAQLHNVRTEEGAQSFNVNTPVGGGYTHYFDVAGGIRRPVRLGCVFHSQMQAWIFVFPHPYFQVTAEDGKFRLQNVPIGDYELEVAHPAGNLRVSRRVTVGQGESTVVELLISPDNLVEQKP